MKLVSVSVGSISALSLRRSPAQTFVHVKHGKVRGMVEKARIERTGDVLLAGQMLSQLSYFPVGDHHLRPQDFRVFLAGMGRSDHHHILVAPG